MDDAPDTLLLHEVPHGGDPSALVDELERQVPNINLTRAEDYKDALTLIESANIVVARAITSELLDRANELDWIQALNAGVDSYDVERIEEMGVTLTNASGVHANPIAEQALGYMLTFERRIHRGIQQQRRHEWRKYTGGELRSKTLCVLGVGEIGERVAELGNALDMTVLGTKRDVSDVPDPVDEIFSPEDTHRVLGRSDYVVVTCPLTDATEKMLGLQEFASMKRDAALINVARGPILDQDDLVVALQKGKIRAAALDVTEPEPLPQDSPLWDLSNVIITPHMAGTTPHYWERAAEIFATNHESYLAGDEKSFVNRVV